MMAAACSDDRVYEAYRPADARGWEKNDAMEFSIDTLTESATYALAMGLRISDAYPFRNLHMVIDQTILPAAQHITDTVTCHVADRQGIMLGRGVTLYQYDLPVRKRFCLAGSTIHVKVRHNMKREILPGVADIGITLRKEQTTTLQ